MKKVLFALVLSASLCSCSLLQRQWADEEGEIRDSEPNAEGPLFTPNGQEVGSVNASSGTPHNGALESEVARLNTKVVALETKLDVLTANVEKMHARRSQPVLEAEMAAPQVSLAAPVSGSHDMPEVPPQISAAPAKALAPAMKATDLSAAASSGAEKDFRSGMQLFQNGQNLEASTRFAAMAKKYPNHLLAGHALYWAGEGAMRAQQSTLAIEHWSELENRYPRSAYIPEALSGLAKAHETQGDGTKARAYRAQLLRNFPKSPVALRVQPDQAGGSAPAVAKIHRASEPELASPEEEAPSYEGGDEADEKAEQ